MFELLIAVRFNGGAGTLEVLGVGGGGGGRDADRQVVRNGGEVKGGHGRNRPFTLWGQLCADLKSIQG